MASKDHKIVRRAKAMTELARLSGLLAERLNVEVPNINTTNRDSELAEIQRIENINGLLTQVLSGSETEEKPVKKTVKHGARQ